jgi:hypothetical protein
MLIEPGAECLCLLPDIGFDAFPFHAEFIQCASFVYEWNESSDKFICCNLTLAFMHVYSVSYVYKFAQLNIKIDVEIASHTFKDFISNPPMNFNGYDSMKLNLSISW